MGDHQESMRGDQRSAQKERYRLQELHERIDMLGNEAHPKLFQQVDRLKERITYHEERLQAAEVNREIGKVMFSSGYKVSGEYGCVLDWGLIELYPTRTGSNLVSSNIYELYHTSLTSAISLATGSLSYCHLLN